MTLASKKKYIIWRRKKRENKCDYKTAKWEEKETREGETTLNQALFNQHSHNGGHKDNKAERGSCWLSRHLKSQIYGELERVLSPSLLTIENGVEKPSPPKLYIYLPFLFFAPSDSQGCSFLYWFLSKITNKIYQWKVITVMVNFPLLVFKYINLY